MGQLKQKNSHQKNATPQKLQNKNDLIEYRNRRQLNPDIDKRTQKQDSSIQLRIDYGTVPKNDYLQTTDTIFKVPGTPLKHVSGNNNINRPIIAVPLNILPSTTQIIDINNTADASPHHDIDEEDLMKEKEIKSESDSSTNGGAAPLSPTSYKEEFYKYLGIDTNPSHDRPQKSENISNAKRRSLRVKVQQIAMNNIAKYNKEIENGKKKVDEQKVEFAPQLKKPINNKMMLKTSATIIQKQYTTENGETKSSICGSQTSSMASSSTKRIEQSDDKIIISVGSSSVSSMNSVKSHKSFVEKKMYKIEPQTNGDDDKRDQQSSRKTPEQSINSIVEIFEQRLKDIPSPGSSERELTTIVRQIRRNSMKSINAGDDSFSVQSPSKKRRFSCNEKMYQKCLLNDSIALCNFGQSSSPWTDDNDPAVIKRSKASDEEFSLEEYDNNKEATAATTTCAATNILNLPSTRENTSANKSCVGISNNHHHQSPSIHLEDIKKSSIESPIHITADHHITRPESICSSSAISPYPLKSSSVISQLAKTDVENYHLPLKFDDPNNADCLLCDDKMLEEGSPATPTTVAAVSTYSLESATPSILKLTYNKCVSEKIIPSSAGSCIDVGSYRKQYKTIYLAGSPSKLNDIHRSSIAAIVPTSASAQYYSRNATTNSSSVLERRNYTKPNNNTQSTEQNGSKCNITATCQPVKYTAKILMAPKSNPKQVNQRIALDAGQSTVSRNVVQHIFDKISLKSINSRTLKKVVNRNNKKNVKAKDPFSSINIGGQQTELLDSNKQKIKKSISVKLDERQKAISQLNSLGIDSNKKQLKSETEKQTKKLSKLQKILKSKTFKSLRHGIRKASFQRNRTSTNNIKYLPKTRLIKRKLVMRKQQTQDTSHVDQTPPKTLSELAMTSPPPQLTPYKNRPYFNDNLIPSEMIIDSTTPPKNSALDLESGSGSNSIISGQAAAATLHPNPSSSKKCFNDFVKPKFVPHLFGANTTSNASTFEYGKKLFDSPVSSTTSRLDSGISGLTVNKMATETDSTPMKTTLKKSIGKMVVQRTTDSSTSSNPLKRENGIVLAALYHDNTIIIIQELEISFWKYPSKIYSIFGVSQQWECLGVANREISGKYSFLRTAIFTL